LGANGLAFVISRRLNRLASTLETDPDIDELNYLNEVVALVSELPFDVEMSKLQNRCYEIAQHAYQAHAAIGETEWLRQFSELCDRLRLEVPQGSAEAEASISAT
ncbi:MAG TPA: hypothetical protein VF135_14440, partial [Terriglobales bacterium]